MGWVQTGFNSRHPDQESNIYFRQPNPAVLILKKPQDDHMVILGVFSPSLVCALARSSIDFCLHVSPLSINVGLLVQDSETLALWCFITRITPGPKISHGFLLCVSINNLSTALEVFCFRKIKHRPCVGDLVYALLLSNHMPKPPTKSVSLFF